MTKLSRAETAFLIVDVQTRLMPVIDRGDGVVRNAERLARGAHVLDLPVLLTEQYVKGLGATVEPLRKALEETGGYRPIEKTCFSAYGCGEFLAELRAIRRKQFVVAGVEAHVCVYQTVADLLAAGHEVFLAADAISSRSAENKKLALRRMLSEGARIASTEMVLFELLGDSGTDEFRAISRLIK
ncbi:MAG TPA: hydrolase [Thermoanaerobaculia bacterium]|jgi:nicotinamidase-related amidase